MTKLPDVERLCAGGMDTGEEFEAFLVAATAFIGKMRPYMTLAEARAEVHAMVDHVLSENYNFSMEVCGAYEESD